MLQSRPADLLLVAMLGVAAVSVWAARQLPAIDAVAHAPASLLRALRSAPVFPPPPHQPVAGTPAAQAGEGATRNLDLEIARIAAASRDPEPLRRAFIDADDLHWFALRLLPAAAAGDGASQYFLYLSLDQCTPYLRLSGDGARGLYDRMTQVLDDSGVDERQQWRRDHQRCAPFAGADLGGIEQAMGADKPGAEAEYASIWFERAAASGYPPAVAEQALRYPGLNQARREQNLGSAAASGDPEVYWLIAHYWAGTESVDAVSHSLAWLIAACRAGYDCTARAPWFRATECADADSGCPPSQSALEHFWFAAPAYVREAAWQQGRELQRALDAGAYDRLAWPPPARE